jgi:hypothetical protein
MLYRLSYPGSFEKTVREREKLDVKGNMQQEAGDNLSNEVLLTLWSSAVSFVLCWQASQTRVFENRHKNICNLNVSHT